MLSFSAVTTAANTHVVSDDTKPLAKDLQIEPLEVPSQYNDKQESSNVSEYVYILKNIFHIVFFISMASIALLSYLQAKKTIFSPIKTEIFKTQLKAFEEVISHFQNKGLVELKRDLDMDEIIRINSAELFDSYVTTFMKHEVAMRPDFLKEAKKNVVGGIVSMEYWQDNFQLVTPDVSDFPAMAEPNDPALKLAKWNDRKYGMVNFTQKYKDASDEISRFQNSPLLPSQLKKLLKDYSDLVGETLTAVGVAIEVAGKEMPLHFQTKESLGKFKPSWIGNIHNDKVPDLEAKAIEILNFINVYLRVDYLSKDGF